MTDMEKLAAMHSEGACCSQIMVYMGLEWRGEQNPQMIQAAGGLCTGMRCGLTCGALTGGILMLGLFDPTLAYSVMIPELVEWFEEKYGWEGSMDCVNLKKQGDGIRFNACPGIVENTYLKAKEILLDNDFEPRSLLDFGQDEQVWLTIEDWEEDLAMYQQLIVDDLALE